MTPLRQRMFEDMQLRGLAPRTQECYVRAVLQFARHYGKSPDLVTEDELRAYFLYPFGSGKGAMLPPLPPLRTARASFPASSSSHS